MSVPKKTLIPALLLLCLVFPLSAQGADPGEIPSEPDWAGNLFDTYARGSRIFSFGIGTVFPVLFLDSDFRPYEAHPDSFFPGNIGLGGSFNLSVLFFLSPRWFLGGDIQPMFASTLGGNMLYIVPLGVRGGYQFVKGPFEFPLSLTLGISPTIHGDKNYLSFPFLKAGASAFFRFHNEWSLGINVGWWFVPEWPKEGSAFNRYGNFVETTVAIRYHF